MNKEKFEKYAKYIVGILVIILGGVIGAFVIKSLVQLSICVFLGLVLFNVTPVLAQFLAYGRIKTSLWGVRQNPVEELILQRIQGERRIEQASMDVTALGVARKDYADKLKDFIAKRPERADAFQTTLDSMSRVYTRQLEALTNAKGELKKFDAVIEEAQDIWDMTQAAQKANKALRKFTNVDPMEEIRRRTALDEVNSSMNLVMAELDTAMALDYQEPSEAGMKAIEQDAQLTPLIKQGQKAIPLQR